MAYPSHSPALAYISLDAETTPFTGGGPDSQLLIHPALLSLLIILVADSRSSSAPADKLIDSSKVDKFLFIEGQEIDWSSVYKVSAVSCLF